MKDWQLLLILIMLWIANDHLQDISRKMDTQVGLAEQQVEQLKKDIFVLQEQEKEIDAQNEYRWIGTASYYSEAGCVGCSPTLTMYEGKFTPKQLVDLKVDELAEEAVSRIRIYATFDIEVENI